uniref:Uncharacterized protein n=1 Tax=Mycena chlorophos TaxID=658473 RepID=A0ABQ0LFV9_MYCCL|nr:predicted protein [Mycena chlorophos]
MSVRLRIHPRLAFPAPDAPRNHARQVGATALAVLVSVLRETFLEILAARARPALLSTSRCGARRDAMWREDNLSCAGDGEPGQKVDAHRVSRRRHGLRDMGVLVESAGHGRPARVLMPELGQCYYGVPTSPIGCGFVGLGGTRRRAAGTHAGERKGRSGLRREREERNAVHAHHRILLQVFTATSSFGSFLTHEPPPYAFVVLHSTSEPEGATSLYGDKSPWSV